MTPCFTSPGGRRFTLAPVFLSHDEWDIFHKGKRAGSIWRTLNYGTTAEGKPRWSASLKEIVWSGPLPPTGLGFDVVGCNAAAECLAQWGHNADEILDWREGQSVRNIYSKTGASLIPKKRKR